MLTWLLLVTLRKPRGAFLTCFDIFDERLTTLAASQGSTTIWFDTISVGLVR